MQQKVRLEHFDVDIYVVVVSAVYVSVVYESAVNISSVVFCAVDVSLNLKVYLLLV